MDHSVPRRSPLFADEPISDLRGLATLTDPDDEVAAVIDLAVMGARGDGKTQFLVHAIRALHARAPALAGTEQELNRQIMRIIKQSINGFVRVERDVETWVVAFL